MRCKFCSYIQACVTEVQLCILSSSNGLLLQNIFDSADPHLEPLPGKWNKELDDFQKIIVLKCLRPDKITNSMQEYVAKYLGQRFIEPQVTCCHILFMCYMLCIMYMLYVYVIYHVNYVVVVQHRLVIAT